MCFLRLIAAMGPKRPCCTKFSSLGISLQPLRTTHLHVKTNHNHGPLLLSTWGTWVGVRPTMGGRDNSSVLDGCRGGSGRQFVCTCWTLTRRTTSTSAAAREHEYGERFTCMYVLRHHKVRLALPHDLKVVGSRLTLRKDTSRDPTRRVHATRCSLAAMVC